MQNKLTNKSSEICYRKIPKFSDAKNFAVNNLNFKQSCQTLGNFVKKVQIE